MNSINVDTVLIFTEELQNVPLFFCFLFFFNVNVHVCTAVRERANSKPVHFIKALPPQVDLFYFHIHPVREGSC